MNYLTIKNTLKLAASISLLNIGVYADSLTVDGDLTVVGNTALEGDVTLTQVPGDIPVLGEATLPPDDYTHPNQVVFFKLDGNVTDEFVTSSATATGISYVAGLSSDSGQAAYFDGNSYIDTDYYLFGQMTVSFWIQTGSDISSDQMIFAIMTNSGIHSGYYLFIRNGEFWFRGAAGNDPNGEYHSFQILVPIAANSTYHVVCLFENSINPNAARIYLNGVIVSQGTSVDTMNHATLPLSIGALPNGSWKTNGKIIDNFRIYNVALSDLEISNLYDWETSSLQ